MSNADSLYRAHSNNSFDSQSQYTGRYLKLFQQQTKNSKIGTSIFSYQLPKQQPIKSTPSPIPPPSSSILPQSSYEINTSYNRYQPSYSTREEKENEIFSDLQRMRNEHLKIMGLMGNENESSRKMEEIEKEITQRRSIQKGGFMGQYEPLTFSNLNNQVVKREITKRDSVEGYLCFNEESSMGSYNDVYRGVVKQEQGKVTGNGGNKQPRFTFAPSTNQFVPQALQSLDSPHHNLKDTTLEFQPITSPPIINQFVHYQKYQQQKKQQYQNQKFSQQSLNYSEMKDRKKVESSDHIIESSKLLEQESKNKGSRGMVLGVDVKVVESKFETGGRLVNRESVNGRGSKVLERETFEEVIEYLPKQQQKRMQPQQYGPPQTSIRTIQTQQTAKNLVNQMNIKQGNQRYDNQYQLKNEVLAKVSVKQNVMNDSQDRVRMGGEMRYQGGGNVPMEPKMLVETVEKQMEKQHQQQQQQQVRYINNGMSDNNQVIKNLRPVSSYEGHKRQQQIQYKQQVQGSYPTYQQQYNYQNPNQPLIQNPVQLTNQPGPSQYQTPVPPSQYTHSSPSFTAHNSIPAQYQHRPISPVPASNPTIFRPLSPRSTFQQSPISHSIRKSIGLAHHNRLGSPSRQLPSSSQPISDYYYNAAQHFTAPQRVTANIPTPSPSRIPATINNFRPTSSGPRAVSPRGGLLHHQQPSSYVPTAFLQENISLGSGFGKRVPPLSPRAGGYQGNEMIGRPVSPAATMGMSSRGFLPRATSTDPRLYKMTNLQKNDLNPLSPNYSSPHTNSPPPVQRAVSPPPRKTRQGISVTSKR